MKTSPKDFFLHLGVMVALYAGAGAIINLIFTIIDYVFPNPLSYDYYGYYTSPISWPVAILIIVFPLYIFLSWLLNKDYRTTPEKRTLGIRKWLIYITLFVSGAVIAGDLIFLLYRFLSGEIVTIGFILKVLATFIVAGAIFSYYISDLRDKTRANRNKIYSIVLGVVILGLMIWGFTVFGSPAHQRMLRVDSQRVSDLQGIQWQLANYWQQKQSIPSALTDLNDPISSYMVPMDPETGEAYAYRKTGDSTFGLCANCSLESTDQNSNASFAYPKELAMGMENENWKHEAGRSCFERTIDPERYPPVRI